MPKLLIKHPEKGDLTFTISGNRISVGRRAENGIQINHGTVSGVHAEIVAVNGHYLLRDLGSTNHSFVNGNQVTEAELKGSCLITFGTVECDYIAEDAKAAAPNSAGDLDILRKNVGILRAQNDELLAKVAEQQNQIEILGSAKLLIRPSGDGDAAGLKHKLAVVTAERDAFAMRNKALMDELAMLRASYGSGLRNDDDHDIKDTVRIKLLPTPVGVDASPSIGAAGTPTPHIVVAAASH
jgi:hypothetical protein